MPTLLARDNKITTRISRLMNQPTDAGGECFSDSALSLGIQIHSTTYNNNPPPKANREKSSTALHIQDGTGVAAPNPPHTPPIILSLDDLVIVFRFCHVLIGYSDRLTVASNMNLGHRKIKA